MMTKNFASWNNLALRELNEYPNFFTSELLMICPFFPGVTKAEHSSRESTQPLEVHQGVLGVGGLGGLYPAVRHYATCHHNGSTYDHGEAVSEFSLFPKQK